MRRALSGGLLSAAALAWTITGTQAEPTNGTIIAGGGAGASIGSVANAGGGFDVTVQQNSAQMVVNWDDFNIDLNDVVQFNQPSSSAIAVNRVVGGAVTPTMIDGALSANGHVWILDPAGVAFGAGAVVDVGGLLATTSEIDTATFMATDPATGTFVFTGNPTGAVTSAANLEAQGLIALVAPMVTNSGSLTSDNGDVLLGGAKAFRLSFAEADRTPAGGGAVYKELLVTDFIIDTGVDNATAPAETIPITQTAAGSASGSNIIISAASAGGGAFLNVDGVVEATNVGTGSGSVMLLGGANLVGGVVAATGTEALRIADLGISATGALTVQGSSVSIAASAQNISVGSAAITAVVGDASINDAVTATSGAIGITSTSGDVTLDAVTATTGAINITATTGNVDVGATMAGTSITLSGQDIDLAGKADATTTAMLTATAGNVSATGALEIEGSAVTVSGPILAATDATITATSGNATLDAVTATTGAINITATTGNVDVGATTAGTSITMSGQDIDLAGKADATTTAMLTATAGNVSATGALEIEGSAVTVSGPILAATDATVTATSGDATLDAVTATAGAISINAATGDIDVGATMAGTSITLSGQDIDLTGKADATTTAMLTATVGDISSTGNVEIEAGSISLIGRVRAVTDVLLTALTGGISSTDSISAMLGDIVASAANGPIAVNDLEATGDIRLVGTSVNVAGTAIAHGSAFLQALTGNVSVGGSVTASGGALVLDATSGSALLNRIGALSDVTLTVADLDLSGSISAGDQFILETNRTGRTIVLGGDGTTGDVTLRRTAGLIIDESELTKISAGRFDIDGGANDVLLLDAQLTASSLDTMMIGTDQTSRIFAAGTVTGLTSLQLGYQTGSLDRRPELILVSGQLGLDTSTGRLGTVRLESAEDIVIGTERFLEIFESDSLTVLGLAALPNSVVGGVDDHVFIAADQLRIFAPGSVVQLNTGRGVEGAGLVFNVPSKGDGVLFPSGDGPEEVLIFGEVIRTDGTRVSAFNASLEDNILFGGGTTSAEPALTQNNQYYMNFCLIGDPVSCSADSLREMERNNRFINGDPSGLGGVIPVVFETGEDDERDQEEDLGGVAASGNEALWDAGSR